MRKTKGIDDKVAHHLDDAEDDDDNDESKDYGGEKKHAHSFEISIHGLRGFEPHNTQVG